MIILQRLICRKKTQCLLLTAMLLAPIAATAAMNLEVGSNDFRISNVGPDGDPNFSAGFPAVAYNSTNNEYLVVWVGDDNSGALVNDELEIYGQRINAATGAEIGDDFRISDMGPDGNANFDAFNPAVVYNSINNEYLVVWEGDDNTLVDNEFEIFGQRLNAATGAELGADFRISAMGPDGNTNFGAFNPAVTYNRLNNDYLVVWFGDDDSAGLVDEELEIFGQRLNALTGAELGADFRISDMGPDGDVNFGGGFPALAYNSTNNEYLVVWVGDDNSGALVNDELEIFGQRINAGTGGELGVDFRISDMGSDGDANFDAFNPTVAYNSINNEYLVAWEGDDNSSGLVNDEFEIFAQRLNAATGAELGGDSRLSDMGPDGDMNFAAFNPAVSYNRLNNEYLVVWFGDDNSGALADEELEIFAQRVNASTGAELGADVRLSDVGSDGNANSAAVFPAVAHNSDFDEYLVVWFGNDIAGALEEFEVFGQRFVDDDTPKFSFATNILHIPFAMTNVLGDVNARLRLDNPTTLELVVEDFVTASVPLPAAPVTFMPATMVVNVPRVDVMDATGNAMGSFTGEMILIGTNPLRFRVTSISLLP